MVIHTNQGNYEFEELTFQLGVKKINREISKENLLALKNCFDQRALTFGLIYGTLLGAIREHDFIEHDEDTDVFVLEEDRELLLETLFDLRELGFEVGRYDSELLSIVKDGEYIDIYLYKKINKKTRSNGGYVIDAEYLDNLIEYELFGEKFRIPNHPENLLEILYGENWRIPDKNRKPDNYGLYLKIRFLLKNKFPFIFQIISGIKRNIR